MAFSIFLACILGLSQAAFCQSVVNEPALGSASAYAKEYWEMEHLKTRIHLAKIARVYISPYNNYYQVALDESRLKQVGCEYGTDDPDAVANLVAIIEAGRLGWASFSVSQFETREAIYLTLSDSSEVVLLFDRKYANRPNLFGSAGKKLIVADNVLAENLYKWAAKLKPVDKCDSFIGEYRQ